MVKIPLRYGYFYSSTISEISQNLLRIVFVTKIENETVCDTKNDYVAENSFIFLKIYKIVR